MKLSNPDVFINLLSSGWLPRLERLANLRGLDQFEKNVLLVLTGSMVSKNLRNTGTQSSYCPLFISCPLYPPLCSLYPLIPSLFPSYPLYSRHTLSIPLIPSLFPSYPLYSPHTLSSYPLYPLIPSLFPSYPLRGYEGIERV
jgi:hypothetical protein